MAPRRSANTRQQCGSATLPVLEALRSRRGSVFSSQRLESPPLRIGPCTTHSGFSLPFLSAITLPVPLLQGRPSQPSSAPPQPRSFIAASRPFCGASPKKFVAAIIGAATTRVFHCSAWPIPHHNRVSATRGVPQRPCRYRSTIRHAPARLSVPLHIHRSTGPGLTQRSSGLAALAAERSPLGQVTSSDEPYSFRFHFALCSDMPLGRLCQWPTQHLRHQFARPVLGSVLALPNELKYGEWHSTGSSRATP